MHEDPVTLAATSFVADFLHLHRSARSANGAFHAEYFAAKYSPPELAKEKLGQFQQVSRFFEQHLAALNQGMALIAGRDAMVIQPTLVLCVYLRLCWAKDGGAGATPEGVMAHYAQLETEK